MLVPNEKHQRNGKLPIYLLYVNILFKIEKHRLSFYYVGKEKTEESVANLHVLHHYYYYYHS